LDNIGLKANKKARFTFILIQLGIDISDDERRNLQHQLTWYMPPYLPVSVR
jgi:hypothetical protein